jgi:hypothetical protein
MGERGAVETVDAGQIGLPRPILNGLPAPYSGCDHEHAVPHDDRIEQCRREHLCGVCGEALTTKRYMTMAANSWTKSRLESGALSDDGLMMDERCSHLALAHCPKMRSGFLMVLLVTADELELDPAQHGEAVSWRLRKPITRSQALGRRLVLSSTATLP